MEAQSWGERAEQLGDQHRFVLDELVASTGLGGLADIPVTERGAGQHVHRPGAGPVGIAAPGSAPSAGPSRTRRRCPGTAPAPGLRDRPPAAPSRTPPRSPPAPTPPPPHPAPHLPCPARPR